MATDDENDELLTLKMKAVMTVMAVMVMLRRTSNDESNDDKDCRRYRK